MPKPGPKNPRVNWPYRLDPPGTPTPEPPPYSAVTVRLSTASTVSTRNSNPTIKAVSAMLFWRKINPSAGVFDFTDLNTSLVDAHTDGYKIIVRIMMGADAPIGHPEHPGNPDYPNWMRTHGTLPVECVRAFANENSRRGEEVWVTVPWDPNLRYWHAQLQAAIGDWLESPCPGGGSHPVKTHVWWLPMNMCTELGSEMQFGYNVPFLFAAYAGTATLVSSITAGQLSFTIQGTITGYPSGPILCRIKHTGYAWDVATGVKQHELVWGTRSGATITVPLSSGRGFSGTNADSHAAGTVVEYAVDNGDLTGTLASPEVYNGITGVFDQYVLNRSKWEATTPKVAGQPLTEANRRSWMKTAWLDSIADCLANTPTDVGLSLAGGAVFQDGFNMADEIVQAIGAAWATQYPNRLFAMSTDLKVNSGGAKPWHYPNTAAVDFLNKARAAGWLIGCQTASSSNVAGADNGDEIIQACEDALDKWGSDLRYIETQGGRMSAGPYTTAARNAWAGGTITVMRDYFLNRPTQNIQTRIPSS